MTDDKFFRRATYGRRSKAGGYKSVGVSLRVV